MDWEEYKSRIDKRKRRERWQQGPVINDPAAIWPYPSYTDNRYTQHGPQLIYGDYHAPHDGSAYHDRIGQWYSEKWELAWLYARKQGDDRRTARGWGYALSYLEDRACEVVSALVEIGGNGYPYYYVSWRYVDGPAPTPLTEDEIVELKKARGW